MRSEDFWPLGAAKCFRDTLSIDLVTQGFCGECRRETTKKSNNMGGIETFGKTSLNAWQAEIGFAFSEIDWVQGLVLLIGDLFLLLLCARSHGRWRVNLLGAQVGLEIFQVLEEPI